MFLIYIFKKLINSTSSISKTFTIIFKVVLFLTIEYSTFSTNINLSAKSNIKDKLRIIKSCSGTSNVEFHRKNIVSIIFLDNAIIPGNAVIM